MGFRFFTVSIHDSGQASAELNAFLQSHKVLSVDRHWVEQGSASFWSFCIDYQESANGFSAAAGSGRPGFSRAKVDYREVLSPADFAVFAKLRDLRKEIAQAEAVPVYTIFTNEQLAKMVQGKIATKAALEKVAGIGDARVEKYGERFLALLGPMWKGGDEANGPAV